MERSACLHVSVRMKGEGRRLLQQGEYVNGDCNEVMCAGSTNGTGVTEDTGLALAHAAPSPAKQPALPGPEKLHHLLLKAHKELSLYTMGKRHRIGNFYRM